MNQAHIAALETTIIAENWSGAIAIRSTLDANVCNGGVERYRELGSQPSGVDGISELNEDSVLLSVRTNQSQIPLSMAARTTVWQDDNIAARNTASSRRNSKWDTRSSPNIAEGESLTVEKVVDVGDRTRRRNVGARDRRATSARQAGPVREISRRPCLAWAQIWERLSIEFDGHTEELRIMRLHVLHLCRRFPTTVRTWTSAFRPVDLHGEAYRGHVFWDELFMFPVLNLRFPAITRALLRYRYRRLWKPVVRETRRLCGSDVPLAVRQ